MTVELQALSSLESGAVVVPVQQTELAKTEPGGSKFATRHCPVTSTFASGMFTWAMQAKPLYLLTLPITTAACTLPGTVLDTPGAESISPLLQSI